MTSCYTVHTLSSCHGSSLLPRPFAHCQRMLIQSVHGTIRMTQLRLCRRHTLPTFVWPPMTSSLLSCKGVTDQPAAGGGPETDSRGLPSWPDGCAASASAGLVGAVQASLFRLYIQMSAR
jgi:hypothetical protein